MQVLIRTNDPVLLSYVMALLADSGIDAEVLDVDMSVMEGSIGAIPRRVVVAEDAIAAAREVLIAAGLRDVMA